MKTIKPGRIKVNGVPKQTVEWWQTRTWTCPNCDAEFQTDQRRDIHIWEGAKLGEIIADILAAEPEYYGTADCPTCGKAVVTRSDRLEFWS